MGGTWSGGATTDPLANIHYHKAGNNNKGDVVVIPVDQSKQSEAAFECKCNYLVFYSVAC